MEDETIREQLRTETALTSLAEGLRVIPKDT